MTSDRFLDLTSDDTELDSVRIVRADRDCHIVDESGKRYEGFILARSPGGNAVTVCELSFYWSDTDGKYAARPTFRRTYKDLADKAVPDGRLYQRISFESGQEGYRQFWQMVGFLYKFKELVDVGDFIDSYRAVSDESVVFHLKSKVPEERKEVLAQYVEHADIDPSELSELLVVRARKAAVEEFRRLLVNQGSYRATYRAAHAGKIKGRGDEAIWHHFLSSNKWIFGLSLNLRFIEDFVDEASVGLSDTRNRGNPTVDVLAWNDYTALVELKTPDTDIFTTVKSTNARANTWSFSPAFIEGFSQCLAQRSAWEEAHGMTPILVKDELGDRRVDQGVIRTIDPQVIFIVGNKDREIPRDSPYNDVAVKRDTLERFARNNRNVNVISYDELYRRAFHIAHGTLPPPGSTTLSAQASAD